MKTLHGMLTSISAIVVLLLSASWIGEKYNIGPNIGLWQQPSWQSYFLVNRETDGVPAIGDGEISIPLQSNFGSISWGPPETGKIVIPVSFGQNNAGGFSSFASGGQRSWRGGGSCQQNVVNLLVVDQDTPAGEPVFDSRVLLPRFFYFFDAENEIVVALVVRNDTNGDGNLDCGDAARFELISLTNNTVEVAERSFIADDLSYVQYHGNTEEFMFTELHREGENITIRSISLSLLDMSIKEVVAPDLLSKARTAFENVGNE